MCVSNFADTLRESQGRTNYKINIASVYPDLSSAFGQLDVSELNMAEDTPCIIP